MQKVRAARELFLSQSFGVLSTISLDVPGYPFGSITPYCVDDRTHPVIYISTIAQHTRNILADPRVSLTVVENNVESDDVQSRGRVTYVADARPVTKDEASVRSRYFRHFPSSRQYDQTHDFAFFRLLPQRIRFIGGFGQIFWIEPEEFSSQNPFLDTQEEQIIQHMNNDHGDVLRRFCDGEAALMIGIDADGFDVLKGDSGEKKVRFTFETPIHSMDEARQALVAMAKQVRGH
jgi:heme iron utilization protein